MTVRDQRFEIDSGNSVTLAFTVVDGEGDPKN